MLQPNDMCAAAASIRTVVMAQLAATGGHAALPDDGAKLADLVAAAGGAVRVDFTGVRSMNSAFSNSFFLRLLQIDPSRALALGVQFTGTSGFQARVLEMSRRAVLNASR